MSLENLTKEQLQSEFERVAGEKPKTAWSKAELIEAINAKTNGVDVNPHTLSEQDIQENAPGLDGLKPGDVIGIPKEPEPEKKSPELKLADNEFLAVKVVDGKVVDEQVMNNECWELLAANKHGWTKKAPEEVQ
jgi:hypothetical protein